MDATYYRKKESTSDENHNTLKIKEEIDNDYITDLESILRYTKEFQQSDDFHIKTEIEEDNLKEIDKNGVFSGQIDRASYIYNRSADFEIAKSLHNHHDKLKLQNDFKSEDSSDLNLPSNEHDEFPQTEEETDLEKIIAKKPKRSSKIKEPIVKNASRKCSYCNYVAKNKEDWKDHRKIQHSKSMKRKCKLCDFLTNSAILYKLHMNKHSELLIHKCQYCDYKSMQAGHLKRHVNSVHTKSSEFLCRSCDFVTTTFETLKKHMEEVHEQIVFIGKLNNHNEPKILNPDANSNEEVKNETKELSKRSNRSSYRCTRDKQLQCQFCDYQTPFLEYLNIHINSRHTQNTVYKCDYCDYQATKVYTLRCHVNSKHTKKVLYKCELCNLETTRSNILKRHIKRIHLKKSFDCKFCNYVAKKEGHIKNHLRKKHGIEYQEIKEEIDINEEIVEIVTVKKEPDELEVVKLESSE